MPKAGDLVCQLGVDFFFVRDKKSSLGGGFGGGDVLRCWLVIDRHVVVSHPNHVVEFKGVERAPLEVC